MSIMRVVGGDLIISTKVWERVHGRRNFVVNHPPSTTHHPPSTTQHPPQCLDQRILFTNSSSRNTYSNLSDCFFCKNLSPFPYVKHVLKKARKRIKWQNKHHVVFWVVHQLCWTKTFTSPLQNVWLLDNPDIRIIWTKRWKMGKKAWSSGVKVA